MIALRPASLFLLFTFCSVAAAAQPTLTTREVATGLDTPWEILWGPDDHIWMTERYGRISRVNPANGQVMPLLTIDDVHEVSEAGLMGMALYPAFEDTSWVFVAYNYFDQGIKVRIARYDYADDQLTNPLILLDGIAGSAIHNGCRLIFLPDNTLLITTGDAGNTQTPQDHSSLNGKVLRMTAEGEIPANNPFPGNNLWSKGHRNAQGLVLAKGLVYSSEHGPNSDDELNIIYSGRNYGWPDVNGFCNEPAEIIFCNDSDVVEPVSAWTPTLAVAGIDYYGGWGIPEWHNSILMTTLKASRLVQLKLNATATDVEEENSFFAGNDSYGRLRDLCVSPDGRVFIATSNKDGRGSPGPDDDMIIEISGTAPG
ncbi:MAG: PQQ-dependent sugar dehydrogenase [Bacteroidia bacterium]